MSVIEMLENRRKRLLTFIEVLKNEGNELCNKLDVINREIEHHFAEIEEMKLAMKLIKKHPEFFKEPQGSTSNES